MVLIATLLIGFSVIAAIVLFITYGYFLHNLNKSAFALITGAALLVCLSLLQLGHLDYFAGDFQPLESPSYLVGLFFSPPMFYLFGRSILFGDTRFTPLMVLHFVPPLLVVLVRIEIAIPILFCVGLGYSVWLTQVIYTLRAGRKQFRFEWFFLLLFTALAIGVLLLGFSLPYLSPSYFYYFYCFAIGISFVMVVGALLGYPELLAELAEAARVSYEASTLTEVNVAAAKQRINEQMTQAKAYQAEDLNLASLASRVELSSHQLSELINTHYDMSFSQFVRTHRVQAAQRLLTEQPDVSVLAIGMEVGFKSQSNFYAAFKAITGVSPGHYRSHELTDT